MTLSFVHDDRAQRVVFARGAIGRLAEEVARLALGRVLVVTTPGSGSRLGAQAVDIIGARAVGLHAAAIIHVPRPIVETGVAVARDNRVDGLVAVGGGSAIGLAKAIALATGLPIVAVPTTYSGSEATTMFGTTEGGRKLTSRDPRVLPRTIVYDPELTLSLPPAVTAASGMNAVAHCVEGLWIPERTPFTVALAIEAMRGLAETLPRAVADGGDAEARSACLAAAWLAGKVVAAGTGLHHKLAHVLGGIGLPHAETHAIILPHVARFNLAAADDARGRLAAVLETDDPAVRLGVLLRGFPVPQRLREVGFDQARIPEIASEVAALSIKEPRPVTAEDVQRLLSAAF